MKCNFRNDDVRSIEKSKWLLEWKLLDEMKLLFLALNIPSGKGRCCYNDARRVANSRSVQPFSNGMRSPKAT